MYVGPHGVKATCIAVSVTSAAFHSTRCANPKLRTMQHKHSRKHSRQKMRQQQQQQRQQTQ